MQKWQKGVKWNKWKRSENGLSRALPDVSRMRVKAHVRGQDLVYVHSSFLLLVLCCDCVFCFSPSLSLFLSQIDSIWHPSVNPLRLRTLFVPWHLLLILPHSCSVRRWEGPSGLPGELFQTWYSFRTPHGSIRLFRYCSTHYNSQSGMGIFMRDTCEMSHYNYTGVLLQYARFRYLYTSVCYTDSRNTYRSHSRDSFRDTTHSANITSRLPHLSTSEDCVQGRTFVSFL